MATSTSVRRARILALLVSSLVGFQALGVGIAQGRTPEHSWSRYVGSGSGEYEGYTDSTDSDARLEILNSNATSVIVRSAYSWTYSSSEGERQSGSVDRIVEFEMTSRRWASHLTDDDDHDQENAANLTVWFWIPTAGLNVGGLVSVLDDMFTVTSLRTTVWSGWLPKAAVELRTTGGFTRNDEYGVYSVTYEDTYYYDLESGYVIAERYTERDEGTYNGLGAGFTWTETVDVVSSSYVIEVDGVALAVTMTGIGIVLALVGYAAYLYRWRRRSMHVRGAGTVRVSRLRNADRLPSPTLSGEEAGDDLSPTMSFSPFLADFARRALLAGDLVSIATRGKALVGMAIFSRDAKVGQVFARDTALAETLRSFVRARDFFSEFRHQVPVNAVRDAAEVGVDIREGDAYNILDTYQVLRLDNPSAVTYDATLVRRMRDEDLPQVMSIARRVYEVDSGRWLRAQYESGDIGFVASIAGQVVGFAFASLVDGVGRLHTLTVLPEQRNRGIGRELVRARINALQTAGVGYVITEIATWNLPSLHLAYGHGFSKVAEMWVETTRAKPVENRLQRR